MLLAFSFVEGELGYDPRPFEPRYVESGFQPLEAAIFVRTFFCRRELGNDSRPFESRYVESGFQPVKAAIFVRTFLFRGE